MRAAAALTFFLPSPFSVVCACQVGNLLGLVTLNLANTSISGAIPTQLGNLASLQSLSLSGTHLSGNLPANLGDSSNVKVAVDVSGSSVKFCSGSTAACGSPYYARVMREGYLSQCLVFIDSDGSGVYDSTKLAAITDTQGTLTIFGSVDGPLVAIPGGSCVDTGSGLPLDVSISAPPGSCVISPLTTIEVAYMSANATVNAAQAGAGVRKLLGIPTQSTTFGNLDYINLVLNMSSDGIQAMASAAKIVDLVSIVANAAAAESVGYANDGSDNYASALQAAASAVYADLASEVALGSVPQNKDSTDAVVYAAISSLSNAVNASSTSFASNGVTPLTYTISTSAVTQIATMATMIGEWGSWGGVGLRVCALRLFARPR